MLTPQQVEEYRKKYNIVPPNPPIPNKTLKERVDALQQTKPKTLQERVATFGAKPPTPTTPTQEPSYLERVGGALKNVVTEPAKYFMESANKEQNPVSAALGTVRRGLEGAGSAIYSTIPQFITKPLEAGIGAAVAQTPLPQAINAYKGFKQENPTLAKVIQPVEDVARIGLSLPAFKGAQLGVKAGVKQVGETIEKAIIKKTEKLATEAKNLTNSVVSGKIKDIPIAQKILTSINTKAVKTYTDLKNVLEEKTKSILNSVDSLLEKDKNLYKPEKLLLVKKIGSKEVSKDFIKEALDHLENNFKNINDISSAERILQLKNKLLDKGLSLQEVNNLAKEYGSEFGKKAFSKTGEPLTGVSAQAAENTRKGIKDTLRTLSPDKKMLEFLDKQASEHIRILGLVSKIEEGVNRIKGKIKPENAIMKAGRSVGKTLGKVVDVSTGGIARNFLTSFLPSNIGNKVMNFLDLENNLKKSLERINKIENYNKRKFQENNKK